MPRTPAPYTSSRLESAKSVQNGSNFDCEYDFEHDYNYDYEHEHEHENIRQERQSRSISQEREKYGCMYNDDPVDAGKGTMHTVKKGWLRQ